MGQIKELREEQMFKEIKLKWDWSGKCVGVVFALVVDRMLIEKTDKTVLIEKNVKMGDLEVRQCHTELLKQVTNELVLPGFIVMGRRFFISSLSCLRVSSFFRAKNKWNKRHQKLCPYCYCHYWWVYHFPLSKK